MRSGHFSSRARIAGRRLRAPIDPLLAALERADVSVFHEFAPSPAGGGHQFLRALVSEWRRRGLRVGIGRASGTTRACLLNSFNFDPRTVRRGGSARVVHRLVGPVSVYRGRDDGTDERVAKLNRELADATVFQSRYSFEAFRERGFEFADPHVIQNAVDPALFYSGDRQPLAGRRVKVVSVSWSDNPNKGGADYAWLDEQLDRTRYEYTFVGRPGIALRNARVVPPVDSRTLAAILRDQDVFVTGARHESSSNALLEALACGLPTLYVRSGANAEVAGEGGLGYDSCEELPAQLDRLVGEYDERRSRIAVPPLDAVADRYLEVLGLAR